MSYLSNILLKLTKGLYPSGRAFRMPDNGAFKYFTIGYLVEVEKAYNNALAIQDGFIPDNDNFTEVDATFQERRFGLPVNEKTSLEDRKAALVRKMNHPGTIKTRQNWRYIEYQLRLAGFDVYVFENRFVNPSAPPDYITKTPSEVAISTSTNIVQHGQFRHGMAQHGTLYVYKIANSIYNSVDALFDTGDNLKSTFFISSAVLGVNAVIPEAREIEFRQLVLKLKPAQTVAFPFISFVPPVEENQALENGEDNVVLEDNSLLQLENSFE